MAALLTGQSVSQTARDFTLPKSTVSRIRGEIPKLELERTATQKRDSLEALLLAYLRTMLTTLQAQAEAVGDPEYVKAQSASELAVLHGVLADKTFRILSALEPEKTIPNRPHDATPHT